METKTISNGKLLYTLWLNWVVGAGAIPALFIMSKFVSALYLPLVAFAFQFAIFIYIRSSRVRKNPPCALIPFLISRVLFWSGVIMVGINLMYTDWFDHIFFNASQINKTIPYIPALVVSPVMVVIMGWAAIMRQKMGFCKYCVVRHGNDAEGGIIKKIYSEESYYQLTLMLVFSAICTVLGFLYYHLLYINTNINSPDKFVFVGIPVLFYIFGCIYLAMRYTSVYRYYHQDVEGTPFRSGFTLFRVILIWDKYICVQPPATNPDEFMAEDSRFDTPSSIKMSYHQTISPDEAFTYAQNLCKFVPSDLRFMYEMTNLNNTSNAFHYLCFLNDDEKEQFMSLHPGCEWMTIGELSQLINTQMTSPIFSSEIVRLHTIAMTWKTYDRKGYRRFKIKNYTPLFKVEDIKNWDVDYNDPHWLIVANNNEDSRFFRIKKLWHKYINGMITKI